LLEKFLDFLLEDFSDVSLCLGILVLFFFDFLLDLLLLFDFDFVILFFLDPERDDFLVLLS